MQGAQDKSLISAAGKCFYAPETLVRCAASVTDVHAAMDICHRVVVTTTFGSTDVHHRAVAPQASVALAIAWHAQIMQQ